MDLPSLPPGLLDSAPGVRLLVSTPSPSTPQPRLPAPIGSSSKAPRSTGDAAPATTSATAIKPLTSLSLSSSQLNPDTPPFCTHRPIAIPAASTAASSMSADTADLASSASNSPHSQAAPDHGPSTPPLVDRDTAWTVLGDHQLASSDSITASGFGAYWPPSAVDHLPTDLLQDSDFSPVISSRKHRASPAASVEHYDVKEWIPLTSAVSADAQAFEVTHQRRLSVDSDQSRSESFSSTNSQQESNSVPSVVEASSNGHVGAYLTKPDVQSSRSDTHKGTFTAPTGFVPSTMAMPIAWLPFPSTDASNRETLMYAHPDAAVSSSRRESAPASLFSMMPQQGHFFPTMGNVNGTLVACYPVAFEPPAGTPFMMESFPRPMTHRPTMSGHGFNMDDCSSQNGISMFGGPSPNNKKTNLYKTELCRSWEEKGSCRYGSKCQFAHGGDEMRNIMRHPKFKTEVCRTFWVSGACPYGKRCCFLHTTSSDSCKHGMVPSGPAAVAAITSTKDPHETPPSRLALRTGPTTNGGMGTGLACNPPATPPKEHPSALFGASVTSYLNGSSSPQSTAAPALNGSVTTTTSSPPRIPSTILDRGFANTSSPCSSSNGSNCTTIGGGHENQLVAGLNGVRISMGPKFMNREQVPGQDAPGPRSRLERLKRASPTSEVPPAGQPQLNLPTGANALSSPSDTAAPESTAGSIVFTNPFDSSVGTDHSERSTQRSSSYFPDLPPIGYNTKSFLAPSPFATPFRSASVFEPNSTSHTCSSATGGGGGIWASTGSLNLPFDIRRHTEVTFQHLPQQHHMST